ncbi:hypothetical protein CC78DRAFT_606109 [Lojkania enalia]|uniref:Uncharacterized protein n=1 Tax=Lojkania enalia TaxID=147567 RepID=A0A9P4N2H1_9PLEO|nr:hypothetical protein CC78DRAFT_606109 [Didymosphaeria enalia]
MGAPSEFSGRSGGMNARIVSQNQVLHRFLQYRFGRFELSGLQKFPTFKNFIRKHEPGKCPIIKPNDPSHAVGVADCVVTHNTVTESKKVWIE